ncbi:glycosyltransferase [Halomonas sp. HG01]|uniref:glycosyltransferase n=1 Tax=Halomonas sp. HG01 TaxID=1609967 RepID=UPI000A9AE340|nr:glycosyltransferase [Halomonas sp. HG01]
MKVAYLQPLVASYRQEVVNSLNDSFELIVMASLKQSSESGFSSGVGSDIKVIDCPFQGFFNEKLKYQSNVIKSILKEKPDIVVACANPRDLTYWFVLLLCKILDIKLYSHGQGPYRKGKVSFAHKMAYKAIVSLSRKFLCYNQYSERVLKNIGCKEGKIFSLDNSIHLDHVVKPVEKKYSGSAILFIGRLREGSNLEILIEVMQELNLQGFNFELYVIGSGDLESYYREKYSHDWIKWFGKIYDHGKIASISKDCLAGCYPGDSGLSVVHMFGLSLPPIVHSNLHEHMGPEPFYISNGKNGFFFNKDDPYESLREVLLKVIGLDEGELSRVGESAYEQYVDLNSPPLGERLAELIKGDVRV